MIRLRARKHIAWLALAAMWLLAAAPVISQMLPPAPGPHAMAMADMDMHCDEHPERGSDPASPHAPALAKCGYCDLLGHSPLMISVAWLPMASPTSPYRLLPVLSAPRSPRPFSLAAAPRGPPGNANA